jgi:hypothetical protein
VQHRIIGDGRWLAFVDESESNRRADPDAYLLAAALVHSTDYEPIAEQMRTLRLPHQKKLHWTDDRNRHEHITKVIAELDVLHVVVVRDGSPGEPSDRRRKKCLERLLYELDNRGVAHVSCEARQRKQNEEDRKIMAYMRVTKQIRGAMKMDHPPGPEEPALWLADAVVGAVAMARYETSKYQQMLAGVLEVITIKP